MLRIVFMGTPEFALPTLSELLGAGHDIVAVYSQPPRPGGRGMDARKSPVHEFAAASGLTVKTPRTLKGPNQQAALKALQADVGVVVAYGLLLPDGILDTPAHGFLNLHPSLLPRWRGAAPIQRSIMAGDKETAVMVMRMDQGLDTGPICLAERASVGTDMTAGGLHDLLARIGADLMVRALAALERGSLDCTPQAEDGITYAKKIEKAEARIVWTQPASKVHDHIRGLSPFPGAWFSTYAGGKCERIKVLESTVVGGAGRPGEVLDGQLTVACGEGAVRLLEVQRAGKAAMSASELLRGFDLGESTVLS